MANTTVTLDFGDIKRVADNIAEAGDSQALASNGSTVKGRFDSEVRRLYATVEQLLRTYQGTDAYALRDIINGFRPHFESMSKTMSAHADFLRLDVRTYQNTQQNNVENTRSWESIK